MILRTLQAAQNRLLAQCGHDMNTWIVGRRPIGFLEELGDPAASPLTEKVSRPPHPQGLQFTENS